jgi:hypothetical protein
LIDVLNGMAQDAVEGVSFGSLGEFAEVVGDLTANEPYTLRYA